MFVDLWVIVPAITYRDKLPTLLSDNQAHLQLFIIVLMMPSSKRNRICLNVSDDLPADIANSISKT